MDFKQLAANRFSVRSFKDTPVEKEKLDIILEAGRLAPTACNNQPQRIKVITGADLVKVDEFTPCRYGAPLVLMVCYDKTVCAPAPPFGTGYTGQVDASIVTAHLMFQAADLELGSLWVMHFDPAKAIEILELPENIAPMAVLNIGYPADGTEPADLHSQRMPIKNMLI